MLNKLQEKVEIPKKIDSIIFVFDVAMYKTGFALFINKKPYILDTILTQTKPKGKINLGEKAILDVEDIYRWMSTLPAFIESLRKIQIDGFMRKINIQDLKCQVIVENGIILNKFNMSTSQKLAMWTGIYLGSCIESLKSIVPGLFRKLQVKIVHPSQWQNILMQKQNKVGREYTKEIGINVANGFIKKCWNLKENTISTDDEADACLIGILADQLQDQLQKHKIFRSLIKKDLKKEKRKLMLLKLINNADSEALKIKPKKLPKARLENIAKWKKELKSL